MNGLLDKFRLTLILVLIVVGASTLLARLWTLQINRRDYYLDRIPTSSSVTVRVPPTRGRIFDRNGVLMVDNEIGYEATLNLDDIVKYYRVQQNGDLPLASYDVSSSGSVRSRKLPEVNIVEVVKETVIPQLNSLGLASNFNADKMKVFYRTHRGLLPYPYRDDLGFEEYARFAEHSTSLPGVNVHVRPKRRYVYGALASHILGFMRQSETGDLPEEERGEFDHFLPDAVGASGVEQSMEEYLRGKSGVSVVEKDEKGRVVGEMRYEPPVAGGDLYLTLDVEFQYLAERLMRNISRGAAVVMDVNNGDIVAMASVPSFNPNDFIPRIDRARWDAYTKDPSNPLLCTALGTYEPGSTYKIVMGVAASLVDKATAVYTCSGGVQYGAKFKKCWIHNKGGAHGALDLTDALMRSCNAYFYLQSKVLGGKPMITAAELLGLGRRTGVELSNEDPGIVMGSRYWTDIVRQSPNARMTLAELSNMSIGQGETKASPVQMAVVAAAMANRGQVLQPRLVKQIVDQRDGRVLYPTSQRQAPNAPTVVCDLTQEGVSSEEIEMIRKGMWAVINGTAGTARSASIEGMEYAGKTGSAQTTIRGKKATHAWFVAFAPYEKPQYAICVTVLGGQSGGKVAAPIARELIDGIFAIERDRILRGKRHQLVAKPLSPAIGSYDPIASVQFEEDGGSVVNVVTDGADVPVAVAMPAEPPEIRVPRAVSEEDVSIEERPDEEGMVVRRAKPVDPETLRTLEEGEN